MSYRLYGGWISESEYLSELSLLCNEVSVICLLSFFTSILCFFFLLDAFHFSTWSAVLRALHIKAKFYNLSFNCFTSYKKKFVRPTMFDIFAARSLCSTKSSDGMKFIAEYCNLLVKQRCLFCTLSRVPDD